MPKKGCNWGPIICKQCGIIHNSYPKGRHHYTIEQRLQQSLARKQYLSLHPMTEETKKRISRSKTGKKLNISIEKQQSRIAKVKLFWKTHPEARQIASNRTKTRHQIGQMGITAETHKKQAISLREHYRTHPVIISESTKSKISQTLMAHQVKDETKDKIRNARLKQRFIKCDTSIELILQDLIKELGFEYEKQYPYKLTLIDVAIPKYKIAIYADGCYWHNCPLHYPNYYKQRKSKDLEINRRLEEDGWFVIRLWEHDLINRENAKQLLISFLRLSPNKITHVYKSAC